jgi:hypothetical protein
MAPRAVRRIVPRRNIFARLTNPRGPGTLALMCPVGVRRDTSPERAGRMLASSNLNKGAGQNASRLSTNLVNIFKVWHFDNPVNGLFMGLEKREADRSRRRSSCKRSHTPRRRGGTADLSGAAPGGGRRRVAPLGGVRAGMAFKGLEDHYGRRKVHIGCVATFNGICGTFQQVSAVPSDTGAW